MTEGFEQLELDNQLCFALYSASRAVTRAYGPLLEAAGITYPQYVTMLVLWEHPDQPLSVGELGTRLHLDSGTLTPLLKRLEALGLVDRRRDTEDERRVRITLTPRGRALRDELADVPARLLGTTGLALAEARTLRDELVRLTAHLGC